MLRHPFLQTYFKSEVKETQPNLYFLNLTINQDERNLNLPVNFYLYYSLKNNVITHTHTAKYRYAHGNHIIEKLT